MDVESTQPSGEIPDIELMARARKGCRSSFESLIRRHQSALVNFFRRMGASSYADDLVQETFLRLYRYRTKYRPTAKFTTFLYTLARHAWIDHLRRVWRQERLTQCDELSRDAGPAGQSPAPGRLDAQALLDRLPEKLRSVVVMSYYQGLRYEDIAQALDVPVGTVKSRMFLAMRQLKEFLDENK